MAAGDRQRLFSLTEVKNLSDQVNNQSSGLLARVNELETNPEVTLIEEHNQTKSYPAFYPIKRGSKLYVSKQAVSGPFDETKWEPIGRATTDDIVIEDGAGAATLKVVSGVPVLEVTDGTETKQFKFNLSSGRLGMPNAKPLADSGDNDAVVKGDLADYAIKSFADNATPAAARVALIDENGKVNFLESVDLDDLIKLNELDWDADAKRFTQTQAPAETASADGHLVVKGDADALYASLKKPVAAWDVDSITTDGSNISVSGAELNLFLGGMTADTTENTVTVPVAGIYRVEVSGIVDSDGETANTAVGVLVNVGGSRVHQLRVYTNVNEGYKSLNGSVMVNLSASDVVSLQVYGGDLYGSGGDYTACSIEYIRPSSD